jgi:hypothetical protein
MHSLLRVHELLEPAWRDAEGASARRCSLIQIAVGYQHLASGNRRRPARSAKGRGGCGQTLVGIDLEAFALAVGRTVERIFQLDWQTVPAFPIRKEIS